MTGRPISWKSGQSSFRFFHPKGGAALSGVRLPPEHVERGRGPGAARGGAPGARADPSKQRHTDALQAVRGESRGLVTPALQG